MGAIRPMGTRTSKRTGYTCVRHTLCGINLFFWFVGCGTLGVGLWLHFSYGGYASLFPSYRLLSADGLCIAAGVISFLVAFLGCCGSWFQSKCLLGSYFALVVFIFVLQFIAGTLGFVYRKEVAELLQTELKAGVKETYRPEGPLAETWDHIHRKLSCCGVHGHKDWFDADAWPGEDRVPDSCCLNNLVINDDVENQSNVCNTTGDATQWHSSGCYRKLHLWLMERLYIVGVVGMSFAFVQLFGLIAALLIVCTGGDKRRRRYCQNGFNEEQCISIRPINNQKEYFER